MLNEKGEKRGQVLAPRDLGLKSDSFHSDWPRKLSHRAIVNVEGGPKNGKTHFALTAPGPIVYFNFDLGCEGIIHKAAKTKEIIVAGLHRKNSNEIFPSYHFAKPVPGSSESRRDNGYLDRVKRNATPLWEKFVADYREALESKARTLIIDTGGAAYALAKLAFHGMDRGKPAPADDPYGQKSGDMKSLFQGLMNDGLNYDKNVLWLHRLKEKWESNKPTGVFVPDGHNQAQYEVQLSIRLTRKKSRDGSQEFTATVGDCRVAAWMNGEKFVGKDCDFAVVMSEVFGTDEEEWR